MYYVALPRAAEQPRGRGFILKDVALVQPRSSLMRINGSRSLRNRAVALWIESQSA